jgi:tetratricopeptide (TPR) repeat protein
MHVPESAAEHITLHSKLNYRKFQWFNTQFAFAGKQDAVRSNPQVTPDYDDRTVAFSGDLSNVSSTAKGIPDVPIVVVAEDRKTLRVLPPTAASPAPEVIHSRDDWTRWNDYGIGLFLQGDLKGAEQAFTEITKIDPQNFDGWTNVGRVRVQEGNTEGAKEVLLKALALKPGLARANFFYARVLKEEGQYDEAGKVLQAVLAQYPEDRVVHNELGRVLFLQKRYAQAVKEFQKTLEIDPEDLQANYNLMLCYTGLGDELRANQHRDRYLRFKADESAQALTGAYRQLHPEDNNERQAVHEHESVTLGATPVATRRKSATQAASPKKPAAGVGR